jgi:hypothetical protein
MRVLNGGDSIENCHALNVASGPGSSGDWHKTDEPRTGILKGRVFKNIASTQDAGVWISEG